MCTYRIILIYFFYDIRKSNLEFDLLVSRLINYSLIILNPHPTPSLEKKISLPHHTHTHTHTHKIKDKGISG